MFKICLGLMVSTLLMCSQCVASSEEGSDELKAKATQIAKDIAAPYNRLPELYKQGQYEQLLQEAIYPAELPFLPMVPLDVQERLLFLYDRYVGMAWYKMAVKNSHDDLFVTEATDNARRYLQHYLELVREFIDPKSYPMELIFAVQMNSAQIYGDLGVVNSQLFPDKILKAHTAEEAKPGVELFAVCVLQLERAYKYYKVTAQALPDYEKQLRNHVECIYEALNKGLLILKSCDACIRPSLRKEIMDCNKKVLLPLDKALADKILADIGNIGQVKEAPKSLGYKKLGPKTKVMVQANEANQRLADISTAANHVLSTSNLLAITDPKGQRAAIQICTFGLCSDCFRFQNQPEQLAVLEGRLDEMEKLLCAYYGLSNDTKVIYQQLYNCFDEEVYHLGLPLLPLIFMKTGKVEAALTRLEALMELEQSKYGKVQPLLRIMYAYNKQLMGDPKPWLAYEKEKAEQAQSKTSAKKKKKAAAIRATVETIKEAQTAMQAGREKAPVVIPQQPEPISRAERDDKGKEEAVFMPNPDFKSAEELKAEKLARHAAKQDERARQVAAPVQQPQMIPVLARSAQAAVEEDVVPEISLVKAYNLKSTPKLVDEEIEIGTWNFTREQLKTYLKAMGCEYRSGRGIHEVLTLPSQVNVDTKNQAFDFNSTHVFKGDQIVTVLIDTGGSLTLPSWDKGYVPEYLRKQITSARNQLKKLAYKALQELEKAKE